MFYIKFLHHRFIVSNFGDIPSFSKNICPRKYLTFIVKYLQYFLLLKNKHFSWLLRNFYVSNQSHFHNRNMFSVKIQLRHNYSFFFLSLNHSHFREIKLNSNVVCLKLWKALFFLFFIFWYIQFSDYLKQKRKEYSTFFASNKFRLFYYGIWQYLYYLKKLLEIIDAKAS